MLVKYAFGAKGHRKGSQARITYGVADVHIAATDVTILNMVHWCSTTLAFDNNGAP